MDAKSGKALWTSDGRQAAHASVARIGDLLVSLESDGELVVARSSQTAFEPLKRYKVAETETWAQPALSGRGAWPLKVQVLLYYANQPAVRLPVGS